MSTPYIEAKSSDPSTLSRLISEQIENGSPFQVSARKEGDLHTVVIYPSEQLRES